MKSNEMIDILFIDGLEERHLIETPTFLGYLFPIASVLEIYKYTYKIFNLSTLNNYTEFGFIEELKSISFKTIGISTNADNIRITYKVIEILKEYFPRTPIILGGPQATYSSQKIIKETKCDVVVMHEGEYKLIKLLDYYINGIGSLDSIQGITFTDGYGNIIENQDSEPICLDELPIPKFEILTNPVYWLIPSNCSFDNFDDFLIRIKFYNNIFLTGRGCPYNCSFCVEGNINSKFRLRSIHLVENDLRHYLNTMKTNYFLVGDDTFTSSVKRVTEITEMFKRLRKEYDFVWFAEGRVNVLFNNPNMLDMMVDAGLYKLQLGIESGNQKVLDIYNKRITIEQIEGVVKIASKYDNLLIHGNLILGNPFETIEDFNKSIDFAKHLIQISKYKMDFACGYLTPFVGTEIRENPKKYGITILDDNFEHNNISFTKITCKPNTIDMADLQNLYSFTENEFTKFYKNNIWNLNKKDIDSKWFFDIYYGGASTGVISRSWTKSIYNLFSLQRYYSLFSQGGYIASYSYEGNYADLIPLKIWDLSYEQAAQNYKFISLNNEVILISGNDLFLYENAIGNLSINELINLPFSPFQKSKESVEYAIRFFLFLEDKYAIIFKEY
jgi:radical SAM superfamily enzyme YgiQ (UPF0313 family)